MSLNFLDTKKVIIFSLLQYSTAMVLKSPKQYTSRYLKKQSKTTFYIHNPYKPRRNLDYGYKDWEEKKPDVYDYLIQSANQTSTTEYVHFTDTSPQIVYPEIKTNPTLESSKHNTLFTTFPSFPSTVSTPDTSLPIPYTSSTPLSVTPSFSTPYDTTTTTLIPVITNVNTSNGTATPSTVMMGDGNYSITDKLKQAKANLKGGFFTAGIYVLLKIIERKKGEDVRSLIIGLQGEFDRLNSLHHLAMFGPTVNAVCTFMVLKMTTVPFELIQAHAKTGQELIENKRTALGLDVQAIFDVVDVIYTEEDNANIIYSLTEVQDFPNITISAIEVAKGFMDAFILEPYKRIEGTAKEKLLLMEIHNFVEKRINVNENKNGGPNFRNSVKTTTKNKKNTKINRRIIMKWPILYSDPTTINSSETDYTRYFTDPIILKQLKEKMRIYKQKFRNIRFKERKIKTKRGPTSTTTTTTTTTVMPPMHKSKYYIRKYVKKNLYKMKISTKKTTRFIWRYYGKIKTIRRVMAAENTEASKYSLSANYDNSDEYFSDSYDDDYRTDAPKSINFTRSMTPTNLKSVSGFNDIANQILYNNNIREGEESKMEIQDINNIQGTDYSADGSDSYYADSNEDDHGTGTHKSNDGIKPMTHTKIETVKRFNANKNGVTNHNLYNNIIEDAEYKKKIQNINKKQRYINKPESSDNNAEAYLRLHLNDALIHTNNITIDRRFMKKKVNKLLKVDSFSDDEAILKGNIYKVFGYSNDFAKQLRTML